jgi:uncharacterized protein
MVTGIYAAILAILIVWLSLQVIKLRRANRVRFGDGDVSELQAAIRAQGNATEYIPVSLLLLLLLELGGAHWSLIHLGGIILVAGRVIHARGLLTNSLRLRVLGMQITFLVIVALAIANLVYAAMMLF